ncbi:MAG: HAD family phosphatase [Oscillospiraceae bacterium]|nr:HAD family phosphatase [Oscillospiraceae bacterium]
MIKAVLFDMDGTILDTEPVYKKAWKSAFERANVEFSNELFDKCVGLPISLTKKYVTEYYNDAELFDITFPMAAAWAARYKEWNGIPIKPGFFELQDFLQKKGIVSVIATSTSHEAAVEDLTYSNIFNCFKGIIGGDDVEKGKPSPAPYIKAAALAGASVDECIAVEDSINGIRSAVSAGVKCVFIRDFLDIPDNIENMIYKRVNDLSEVIGVINNL